MMTIAIQRAPRHARGFTLIEVLVAVLIFALVSAAAYVAIDTLLRSRHALHERSQSLQQMQKAMMRIERDLRQAMAVPVRNEYGEAGKLLLGTPTSIELTRTGLSNPLGQVRARIEHVQWALQDERIQRARFEVLDRAVNSKPAIMPMLDDVTELTFSYFDGEQWRRQWPRPDAPPDAPARLPVAVAMELETTAFGRVRRVITLVDPSARSSVSTGGDTPPTAAPGGGT